MSEIGFWLQYVRIQILKFIFQFIARSPNCSILHRNFLRLTLTVGCSCLLLLVSCLFGVPDYSVRDTLRQYSSKFPLFSSPHHQILSLPEPMFFRVGVDYAPSSASVFGTVRPRYLMVGYYGFFMMMGFFIMIC